MLSHDGFSNRYTLQALPKDYLRHPVCKLPDLWCPMSGSWGLGFDWLGLRVCITSALGIRFSDCYQKLHGGKSALYHETDTLPGRPKNTPCKASRGVPVPSVSRYFFRPAATANGGIVAVRYGALLGKYLIRVTYGFYDA